MQMFGKTHESGEMKFLLSRRDFLNLAGYFSTWIIADLLIMKTDPEGGRGVNFSTSGADYALITGIHSKDAIPLNPDKLPDNCDAVFVEWAEPYLKQGEDEKAIRSLNRYNFTCKMFEKAEKIGCDLIFADLPVYEDKIRLAQSVVQAGVIMGSMPVVPRLKEGEWKNLQDTLRIMGLMWSAANDFGHNAARGVYNTTEGKLSAAAADSAEKIEKMHPEHAILTLRNPTLAAKAIKLEEVYRQKLGRKPVFGIVGGASHFTLSTYLEKGREVNLGYIRKMYPPAVSRAAVSDERSLYTSLILKKKGDRIIERREYEDVEMKQRMGLE